MDPSLILSCDWGTTSLRLRLVTRDAAPAILATFRSAQGVATLAENCDEKTRPDRFAAVLADAIAKVQSKANRSLEDVPVVISGMASSSIGWKPLAYANLPQQLTGESVALARTTVNSHPVLLISGVRDDTDVMRGEETELIGLATLSEIHDSLSRCTVIVPGTHSKHAQIVDRQLVSFRTLMSGEMFAVLSQHSVLQHSVRIGDQMTALGKRAEGPLREAFVDGVRDALRNPLLNALFHTRTRQLLQNKPADQNAAFLSGIIIGSEIGTLAGGSTQAGRIVLCAGSAVAEWYGIALDEAGLAGRVTRIAAETVDELSIRGHVVLANRFEAE